MSTAGLIEVYLTFDNNCLEALEFYQKILGGEITSVMRFSDMPSPEEGGMDDISDDFQDGIMHATLQIGDRSIMGSDNPYGGTVFGDSVTLNWSHPDPDEVRRVWKAFTEAGSTVEMELEESFFAKLFGLLTDPFGINWQIMHWSPGE